MQASTLVDMNTRARTAACKDCLPGDGADGIAAHLAFKLGVAGFAFQLMDSTAAGGQSRKAGREKATWKPDPLPYARTWACRVGAEDGIRRSNSTPFRD